MDEEIKSFIETMKEDCFKETMMVQMKKVEGLREELKKEEELMKDFYQMERDAAETEKMIKERKKKKDVNEESDEEKLRRWREREDYEEWYRDHVNDPSYRCIYDD